MGDCPDIDVILFHASGMLPYVGSRIMGSLLIPDVQETVAVDWDQASRNVAMKVVSSESPYQLDVESHIVSAPSSRFHLQPSHPAWEMQ